jgi:hypothetical protein
LKISQERNKYEAGSKLSKWLVEVWDYMQIEGNLEANMSLPLALSQN